VTVTTKWYGEEFSKMQISVKTDNETVDTLPAFVLPDGATCVSVDELLYGAIPVEE